MSLVNRQVTWWMGLPRLRRRVARMPTTLATQAMQLLNPGTVTTITMRLTGTEEDTFAQHRSPMVVFSELFPSVVPGRLW